MHLRYASKAISILDPRTIQMRLPNLTLAEKSQQTRRNFDLPAVRPCLMNSFVERLRRAFQCFERHCAGKIRQIQKLPGAPPADKTRCQRRLRSIQECEPFLRLKLQRLKPDRLKCFAPGDLSGRPEDFTFPDQDESEMRHRSKISTRADAAAARNDRMKMMIQQLA